MQGREKKMVRTYKTSAMHCWPRCPAQRTLSRGQRCGDEVESRARGTLKKMAAAARRSGRAHPRLALPHHRFIAGSDVKPNLLSRLLHDVSSPQSRANSITTDTAFFSDRPLEKPQRCVCLPPTPPQTRSGLTFNAADFNAIARMYCPAHGAEPGLHPIRSLLRSERD
jgi:hypothetical protein